MSHRVNQMAQVSTAPTRKADNEPFDVYHSKKETARGEPFGILLIGEEATGRTTLLKNL